MRREEFYEKLTRNLDHFTKEEKKELEDYYEELICDGVEAGVPEEEVIDHLENPEEIAKRLNQEHQVSKENQSVLQTNGSNYTSSEPVRELVLRARDRGFSVKESADDQVHIHCEKGEFDEIICNESHGTFYFRQDTKKGLSFARFFSFHVTVDTIEVRVPKGVEIIQIRTTNGGIGVSNLQPAHSIQAESTNAGIKIGNSKADTIEAITTNGGIKLNHLACRSIRISSSNASIKMEEIEASEEIKCRTTNAAIHFDGIRGNRISVVSSNGAISGTVQGSLNEYAIESHTTNGSSNLPTEFNTDQPKKLKIVTSNGKIHIDFAK